MYEEETVISGDLFVGDATYIKGEWVRRRDYDCLQGLSARQGEEIVRLREDLQRAYAQLREAQPPRVASVIERHKDLDYVKQVDSAHWGPDGVHVVLRPDTLF